LRTALVAAIVAVGEPMGLRSLIVDDNTHFLGAARDLLEREGMEVVGVASSGDEAADLAQKLRPDVTLVDIDLGEESGIDVARRLADAPGGHTTRVVLISAHSEDDFADLVSESPAAGFLTKSDLSAGAIYELLERTGDAGIDSG
jgi:DNA-binding NarL/FixJ family response regulator